MKRKLEIVNSKSKDSNTIKQKAPLKSELIIQMNELQEKYNELKANNEEYLETIKSQQEKIDALVKEKHVTKENGQTENELELDCRECGFSASNNFQLGIHIGKTHESSEGMQLDDLDSSQGMRDCKRCDYVAEDRYEMDGHLWSEHEDDEDGTIICKFCEEKFASIANLMTHKKIKHREKIKICENYNAEGCPFED